EPQRRKKDLAKRSNVNYTVTGSQSLQTRHWPPRIAKLRVVVILDNPGAAGARKFQQGETPGKCHRCPKGKLPRGRYVNQPGRAGSSRRRDRQSLTVDRNRRQFASRSKHGCSRAQIA